MAGSADAIGNGQHAAPARSGGPAPTPEAEADTHARTYRLYDREAGFTLLMFLVDGLLLCFGPLHEPILFVLWAIAVNGALFAAQLLLMRRRGGMVKVDPLSREISWTSPSRRRAPRTWRFDEIAAIDTPRKGCTDVVRVDTGDRKLLLQVPAHRAVAIADWLSETLAPVGPQVGVAATGAVIADAT